MRTAPQLNRAEAGLTGDGERPMNEPGMQRCRLSGTERWNQPCLNLSRNRGLSKNQQPGVWVRKFRVARF